MAKTAIFTKRSWWQPLLLVLLPIVCYWPALGGKFVFDDELLVTNCDLVKLPDGLYRIWFTTEPVDFNPVSFSSFWGDWRVWGNSPTGYHGENLVLHIAGSILLWILLRRLGVPAAFLAALLFAVHPVNVESVAWIAQRRNVLAMLFALISALCYLKSDPTIAAQRARSSDRESHRALAGLSRWYWLSVGSFILGMLSKGSVAVLPALFLWITWWKRPLRRADWLRMAPCFLIAAGLILVNIWYQSRSGELIRSASFLERLLGAGAAIWFYLCKAIWPVRLSFIYPQWEIRSDSLAGWAPLVAAVALTIVLWKNQGHPWVRAVLVAWGFFCIALVPVMGFADVGFMHYSLVADHYQHLALVAVVALMATSVSIAMGLAITHSARLAVSIRTTVVVLVAVFALLTWRQSGLYADSVKLYEDALRKNPGSWLVHANLAAALRKDQQIDKSIDHARRALELNPNFVEGYDTLGGALLSQGNADDAIAEFRKALELRRNLPVTHNNLGAALASQNRIPEAIAEYQAALDARPNYPSAHNNLGLALVKDGKFSEAIDQFQAALELEPGNAEIYDNLGQAFDAARRHAEAIDSYRRSLALAPEAPKVHYNLGLAYLNSKDWGRAIEQFDRALRLNPASAQSEVNWAVALVNLGQIPQAVGHLEHAVQIDPNLIQAQINLAILYGQLKRPADAKVAAERALERARTQDDQKSIRQIEALQKEFESTVPKH